ncbi:MAG: apolipoprotein N-acyltransferase [Bacteriovoracaceae bacterium]
MSFKASSIPPYLLCLLGGVFYALGFPSKSMPQFFLFPTIGTGLFFYFAYVQKDPSSNFWRKYRYLFFYSLGLTFTGFYWIPRTLHVFGELPLIVSFLLGGLFALIVLPQHLFFLLLGQYVKRIPFRETKAFYLMKEPLFLSLVLTLLELYIPQQFPAHLGHPWLQLAPYIGLAPIVGSPGFSFISYLLIFTVLFFIKQKRVLKLESSIIVIFLALNLATPLSWDKQSNSINIRMVQANIGNMMKLDSEKKIGNATQYVIDTYKQMSLVSPNEPIDLIIWPETAYPNQLTSHVLSKYPELTPKLFRDVPTLADADLYFGGYDSSNKARSRWFQAEYNAGFFFTKDGNFQEVYHKRKLIPFGEGLPFGPLNPTIGKFIDNISFFAQGERFPTFTTSTDLKFISAICYEVLFTRFIRSYYNSISETPHFMINVTNDSWYDDTSEPLQHLFLAKWRALEFQVPIIRMTNTGISSILYPDGSESERSKVFTKKTIDLPLYTKENPDATIYQRHGLLILFLLAIVGIIFRLKFSSLKKSLPSKDHGSV